MKPELNIILSSLFVETGYDFRHYRESTLNRRIARRLQATGGLSPSLYLTYLQENREEQRRLVKDLTIHVTEFFREPEDWEIVRKTVIPQLLDTKARKGTEIKVWSAGCATGEEAYSLAILLREATSDFVPPTSILGTDLDTDSLQQAREGVYSKDKLKSVSPDRHKKYFLMVHDEQYQISPKIKEGVDFRQLDLVNVTMPEKLDLVSCRNVLIYFSKELQEKVLLKFYEVLRPDGFLWLGKAESLWGKTRELFECVDKGAKIFRRVFPVKPRQYVS